MSGPGEYVADRTEGITRVEDLPEAKVVKRSRNLPRRPCPQCGRSCYRHRTMQRTLHDLGDLVSERPRDIRVTYSQHHCCKCKIYFNADMLDLALPKSRYTHRVIALAVRLVVEDGLPYRAASWHLCRDHRVFVPFATIQNWVFKVFGDVPHQVCEFHVIKELTKAVLRAVAKVRKELAATKPKLGRGRPSSVAARKAARRRKQIDQKVGDLLEHRYLFVRHDLTWAQQRTLQRITRGRRELRTLRDIMDQVYGLFDRRCRTETAVDKLARLRGRVRRFKSIGKTLQKLFSPNLEKALTFLDDKLLPSTSNAVERGYRRHRKMQKTVYRVRTKPNISSRIALDMQREERSQQRQQTTRTLHAVRVRKAV